MGGFFSQIVNHLDVVFSALLNRAVAGTLLILAACLYRALLPKAPKWSRLTLWALAGIRLVLPFSIKSGWSLVPSEQILDYRTAQYAAKPQITSGIAALNRAVNPAFGESFAANPAGSINPLQSAMLLAGLLWAVGLLFMLALALVSFSRLRRRVRVSIELEEGVRLCDGIDTPFLLGLFRPVIYLPSDLEQAEQDCILAHERSHLHHGDCVWKLLGYGILCAYWFYLPVWLAYSLFCRDLELACDERVVKGYSLEEKKRYASVLLVNSLPRGAISACPLAFGEVGVKERVKRVLDKRPAKILVALALAICLAIGVCFATSPREELIYGLSSGTYVMDEADAVQILPSRVTFRMSGDRHEFVFMLSPISSYYMAGDFTISDGFVTCSDGMYTLVFKIQDNDTIVLQIPDQDGLHMNGLFVPNGTEFHYEEQGHGTLAFYDQPSDGGTARADFHVDFGQALERCEVWAELWQDGVCTKSDLLALTKEDEVLHLTFARADGMSVRVSAQADVSGARYADFSLPTDLENFDFITYSDGETQYPGDGSEYVLAVLGLDLKDERQLVCMDFSMEPALYEQTGCTLLVKASFSSAEWLR